MELDPLSLWLLVTLVSAAAFCYSSVGHAGASGYLAAMALFGVAPSIMKPAALLLNILVALVTTLRFWRAGHCSLRLFWPFAAGSIPCSFLGGRLALPAGIYHTILGIILIWASGQMLAALKNQQNEIRPPQVIIGILAGAGIGFISGLIGVGGGIFLSPLIMFAGWAGIRHTAGTSAPFILVNSVAGLAGLWSATTQIPAAVTPLAIGALAGGFIGSKLGATRLPAHTLKKILALVLAIAGIKLIIFLR